MPGWTVEALRLQSFPRVASRCGCDYDHNRALARARGPFRYGLCPGTQLFPISSRVSLARWHALLAALLAVARGQGRRPGAARACKISSAMYEPVTCSLSSCSSRVTHAAREVPRADCSTKKLLPRSASDTSAPSTMVKDPMPGSGGSEGG